MDGQVLPYILDYISKPVTRNQDPDLFINKQKE